MMVERGRGEVQNNRYGGGMYVRRVRRGVGVEKKQTRQQEC